MKKRNILDDLNNLEIEGKRLALQKVQYTALSNAIDISIKLEDQELINELHRCLKATISLNEI